MLFLRSGPFFVGGVSLALRPCHCHPSQNTDIFSYVLGDVEMETLASLEIGQHSISSAED